VTNLSLLDDWIVHLKDFSGLFFVLIQIFIHPPIHPAFCGFVRVSMEGLTESEIAGFAVGAFLLGASIAAQRVDGFIATSQRRSSSAS
jgi:hypothetical protein